MLLAVDEDKAQMQSEMESLRKQVAQQTELLVNLQSTYDEQKELSAKLQSEKGEQADSIAQLERNNESLRQQLSDSSAAMESQVCQQQITHTQ